MSEPESTRGPLNRKPKRGVEELGLRLMIFFILGTVLAYTQFRFEMSLVRGSFQFKVPSFAITGMTLASFFFASIVFSLLNVVWQIRAFGLMGCVSLMTIAGNLSGAMEYYTLRKYTLAAPSMALCTTLPFLLARYFIGWQLVFSSWESRPQKQYLTLNSMLVLTSIVGICVAGLQNSDAWIAWMKICLYLFAFGAAFLPFVFLIMRSQHYWFYFWLTGGIAIWWGFLEPLSVVVVGGIWLGFGLATLRCLGCRLVTNREVDSAANRRSGDVRFT